MKHLPEDVCLPIKTILLAEDDHDDRDFITEAFYNLDKSLIIHTVPNGNKVLPFLDNLPDAQLPQLLILDFNLPELDGAGVLEQLLENKRYQSLPKIVWSTSNSPQYRLRSLKLGALCYIVKPSTISGIEASARQMLHHCLATV